MQKSHKLEPVREVRLCLFTMVSLSGESKIVHQSGGMFTNIASLGSHPSHIKVIKGKHKPSMNIVFSLSLLTLEIEKAKASLKICQNISLSEMFPHLLVM